MARTITKSEVLAKKPLQIDLRKQAETNKAVSISDRIFRIFHDPVVYQVQHDQKTDVVYVTSKSRSKGLPTLTVTPSGLVTCTSSISNGASFDFYKLQPPEQHQAPAPAPAPEWDESFVEPLPVFETKALYPPAKTADVRCSRLTESLVEIFAVHQKQRRNGNLRTWTYGLTSAGTYVAVNEIDRFIAFETRDLLSNYEARQRQWFTVAAIPEAQYVHTDKVCIMDCLDHLTVDSQLAELQIFNAGSTELAALKISWSLIKLSNGYYCIHNNRHNASWFVHPQLSVVLAHMKDESRFAFSSNNRYEIKWISDSLDISVVQ